MKNQSGNVLFLILIAVALFAALSYAVTSSSRNSSSNANKEKAKSDAAAILSFVSTLNTAIMRMKISNSCTDYNLDLSTSIFQRNDGTGVDLPNSNAPSDEHCHVFKSAGGNVIPIVAPASSIGPSNPSTTSLKPGHWGVSVYQVTNVGTDAVAGIESANDLIYQVNYLNKATCLALNDILGINNPSGEAPVLTTVGAAGTYSNGSYVSTRIGGGTGLDGKPAFCRLNSGYYYFQTVLIAR